MQMEDIDLALRILTQRLKKISDTYANRFDINRDDGWYLGKMSEELGELHAAYFKLTGRGRLNGQNEAELKTQVEDELADLFAHVLLFSLRHDIGLADALTRKWLVYENGPHDNRDEKPH